MPKFDKLSDLVRGLVNQDDQTDQANSPLAFDEPLVTTRPDGTPLTISDVDALAKAIAERSITVAALEQFLFRPAFAFDRKVIDAVLGVAREGRENELLPKRDENCWYYIPSSTGAVMELINRVTVSRNMVVYDIGSGWGKPAMLLALLTGANVVGVDWEPSYCAKATEAAAKLNIDNARFVCADVRDVDLIDGDVFYLFHPFEGDVLEDFLDTVLMRVALQKPIIVVFEGPGRKRLRSRTWLVEDHSHGRNRWYRHSVGVFHSDPRKVALFLAGLGVKQGQVAK
jgi:hypothetical protein